MTDTNPAERASRADGAFPTQLSGFDAVMWRIETDPVLRSPILVVGMLDREPDPHLLLTTVAAAVEVLPRLRQRLATSPTGGRPRWVDDPAFCLAHHLHRIRAPQAASLRTVLELAEPSVMDAFEPDRPMWHLTIVDGIDSIDGVDGVEGPNGGKAAFVLRFHHTITDGVGGVELATRLLFGQSEDDGPPPPTTEQPDRSATPTDRAAAVIAAGLGATLAAIRNPIRAATSLATTASSVARMLQPASGEGSPLFDKRSLDRYLASVEVPFDQLRGAAHAAGASVNDVMLAAVGGALRRYHHQLGSSVRALRVTMPISIRREGDPPGGNRFVPARFVLPVDDPDPAMRARIAGAIAHRWRAEPGLDVSGVVAGLMARVPGPVLAPLFAGLLKQMDVDAVDVPGLRRPAFFADARIERMWAFAPPTGAALSVTLLSHLDVGCVGVVCDRAAVTDPPLLVKCLQEAFDEVIAVGDQVLAEVSA